uniref:Phospholipase A2 n=1 Tax=Acrobeloides nanus TaxID=290746 RepID=A0A914EKL2_9BILA
MVKSALWDLTFVTQCKLGIPATYYNGYGCHCGVGGAGRPIDGIDECCMRHDKCYDNARDSLACSQLYILHYSYTCLNNETICYDNQDKCKDALCQSNEFIKIGQHILQ